MKKADVAMIILIATLSVGIAFFVVSSIPGLNLSSESSENVKTIDRYNSTIDEPDKAVFNDSAINPTVDITIGGSSEGSS